MKINKITFTEVNSIYGKKMKNKQDMTLKQKYYSTNSVLQSYPANFYINNFVSFKGNNELFGYDKEKEKISELLINPINRNQKDIPSGIIISEADDTTGNAFIDYIKTNVNANVVSLNTDSTCFVDDVYSQLKKAKENYLKTGKRTILAIKNSDILLCNKNMKNVANTKGILLFSSNKPEDEIDHAYATTFLLETENPQSLNKGIFEHVSDVVHLPLRTKENNAIVLEAALDEYGYNDALADNEFNLLVEKITPNTEKGAYSDSKIFKTMKKVDEEYNLGHRKFAEVLFSAFDGKRDIPPYIVKKSDKTTQWLAENNYIDGIKIANTLDRKIEELLSSEEVNVYEQEITNELSDKEAENIALISSISNFKAEDLKDVTIGDTSLIDFWLDLENSEQDKNRIKQNDRLKNIWFNATVKDEEKVKNFISITLDKLQNENELIKTARDSYKDIIENDTTITDNQKEILVKQQENLLFFKVISNKLNADDILEMEVNILDTLEQLENEKSSIKENATNNIFTPVRNSAVLTSENAEDIENTEYIIDLAKEAMQNSNSHREILSVALEEFSQAKLSGDNLLLDESWNKIVDIGQEYFETDVLDSITNRNIELLNSINEKVSNDDSKKIKDLTKDKTFSIEQREFIARYKDDKNFKILLNNQNIDTKTIIENLVFFETSNKALFEENNIDDESINFAQIMSDKFKQINNENKDIKIQTDRVLDKLGEIETTISDFSGHFNSFANDMLDIEINQLQQITMGNDYLYAISNNTKEIKEYTQAITRAKLVELGKDKYYKDIIPEITKLLPDDEQINLKDFMQKVETLAKHEKDAKRKKTIIKVGIAVAGTLAVGAGVYYFGPQIVAHLASKLPVTQVGLAANEAIKTTNVAKRIGNSQLVSFKGRSVAAIQADIKRYEGIIKSLEEQIIKHPDDSLLGVKLANAQKRLSELLRELSKAI